MNTTTKLAAAVSAALFAQPLVAQETSDDQLEEMIVTSSRIEMPLRQVGTSVSVLTADDIQALGYTSLLDAMRTMPSIGVSNNGGVGKISSMRVRGEESYRTLVLLDGIDITDTSGPQFSPRVEHLLSAGVERVEVLRGPQGLMYGADAGGIVNITTTSPEEGLGGNLSAEGGRYGTQQLGASLGYGSEALDGNLSVTDFETDGFDTLNNGIEPKDDDGYDNTTVHGRLGWNATEALRFELAGHDVDSESEYDDCYNAAFAKTNDCYSTFEQQAWRASALYNTERFTHDLGYSESETERKNYSEGAYAFGGDGKLEKWHYLGSFTASDAFRLVYGADLRSDSRDDDGVTQERDQDGYYLEYQGNFDDRLFLTAGARYDDNDDFGSYDTWRVSGAYLIPVSGGEVKLRGTYGTGFRAPSLYEIAYNNGPWGNQVALDAEESEGYDLAVSWHGESGLFLEAVYFDQTVDNEIYFDLVTYSGYLQGQGETDSSGVELIADWPINDSFTVNANYTYNDTEQSIGDERYRRPDHLANLGVSWRLIHDRLQLGLQARIARDAIDVDGEPLDDYEVLDLNASFALLQNLEIYGRVENALDEDYEVVRNYNTSGAAAYAGIRYNF